MQLQMGMGQAPAEKLPALRPNLELLPGPRTGAGAPTWTIHDPIAGRYFRIGWLEFEILAHWRAGEPVEAVMVALRDRPLLQVDEKDIKGVADFLRANALTSIDAAEDTDRLIARARAQQKGVMSWVLKNYLYLKVPLVRPDRWLEILNRHAGAFFFSRGFAVLLVLSIFLSAWLVSENWSRWFSDLSLIKTPQGLALTAVMVFFAKIIHEIGHGLAAKHYGCRVPRMGVALILLWPVLWTDTTHAWRLTDRKQRLMIDSAGVLSELALASLATLLWVLSPDGVIKSALHILSGVTWIMTLAMNANPFMRFDGYYILGDAVDIPNLQDRAFAHAKWWLRTRLLGLVEAAPELWPARTKKFLLVYAIGCWVYRLILFTGIALIVYAYFFKVLGLILFAIEIWYFILRPMVAEAKVWRQGIKSAEKTSVALRVSLTVLLAALVFTAVPIHRAVTLPGYLRAPQENVLEAPVAARLSVLNVRNGQTVKKGDVLAVLEAPDLAMQARLSRAQASSLQRQFRQQALPGKAYDQAARLHSQMASKAAEGRGYEAGIARLLVQAQTDGTVRDIPSDLRVGDWLAAEEAFGLVVGHGLQVLAYATEGTLPRLLPGQSAYVVSSGVSSANGLDLEVKQVDVSPVETLAYPEMSAEYGGDIPMRPGKGQRELSPAQQVFTVFLVPSGDGIRHSLPQSGPVKVIVTAEAYSPLLEFLRNMLSILVRESGF